MLLCKKKKCSHANICSDTRLYRYICFRHQRHTAGFGETFRLVRRLRRGFRNGHRWRYDTRPVAGCDSRLDDRPHLSDMYRTGIAVGYLLRKAPYPSAQYILYIRHHRPGTVYGGGRGQEPGAGLSFLGGHYHGQHHRSRGRCDTRCVYQ